MTTPALWAALGIGLVLAGALALRMVAQEPTARAALRARAAQLQDDLAGLERHDPALHDDPEVAELRWWLSLVGHAPTRAVVALARPQTAQPTCTSTPLARLWVELLDAAAVFSRDGLPPVRSLLTRRRLRRLAARLHAPARTAGHPAAREAVSGIH